MVSIPSWWNMMEKTIERRWDDFGMGRLWPRILRSFKPSTHDLGTFPLNGMFQDVSNTWLVHWILHKYEHQSPLPHFLQKSFILWLRNPPVDRWWTSYHSIIYRASTRFNHFCGAGFRNHRYPQYFAPGNSSHMQPWPSARFPTSAPVAPTSAAPMGTATGWCPCCGTSTRRPGMWIKVPMLGEFHTFMIFMRREDWDINWYQISPRVGQIAVRFPHFVSSFFSGGANKTSPDDFEPPNWA